MVSSFGGGGFNERWRALFDLQIKTTGAEKAAAELKGLERGMKGATAAGNTFSSAAERKKSEFKAITSQAATTGLAFYGINVAVSTLIGGLTTLGSEVFKFETGMKNVQIAGGYAEDQINDISKSMIEGTLAGDSYGSMLGDSANALYEIEQAGFHGAKGQEILAQSQQNAAAGQADLIDSSRLLTAELNAYAGTGLTARQASDSLFQTILDGVINFDQLSQHMGQVIPTAAALGVNVQNLGAAIAVLTQRGQEPAQALTAINQFLTAYLKPSSAAVDLSKRLGIEFTAEHLKAVGLAAALQEVLQATNGNETAMTTLFGNVRALRAIFPLAADGGELFNKMLANQIGAGQGAGAQAEALALREQTLAYKFKEAWAQGSAFVTGALLPMAQAFLGPVAAGLSGFLQVGGPVLLMIANFEPLFMAAGVAATFFLGKLVVAKLIAYADGLHFVQAGLQAYVEASSAAAAADTARAASIAAVQANAQARLQNDALRIISAARGQGPMWEKIAAEETVAAAGAGRLSIAFVGLRAAALSLFSTMWPFLLLVGAITAGMFLWNKTFNQTSEAEDQAKRSTDELTSSIQGLTQAQFESAGAFHARQIATLVAQTDNFIAAQKELGIVLQSNGMLGLEGVSASQLLGQGGLVQVSGLNAATDAWHEHIKALFGVVKGYSDVASASEPIRNALAAEAHAIGQLDTFLGDANDEWATMIRRKYAVEDFVSTLYAGFGKVGVAVKGAASGVDDLDNSIENLFNKPSGAEAALNAIQKKAQAQLAASELLPATPERLAHERALQGIIENAGGQADVLRSGREAGQAGVEAGFGPGFYNGIPGITAGQGAQAGAGGSNAIVINGNTFIIKANDPDEMAKSISDIVVEEILLKAATRINQVNANTGILPGVGG